MRQEPTHFIEVWKSKSGFVYNDGGPVRVENIRLWLGSTEEVNGITIAIFKIRFK